MVFPSAPVAALSKERRRRHERGVLPGLDSGLPDVRKGVLQEGRTQLLMWKKMKPPLVTSLVTTANRNGQGNASPKSWWTPVNYDPPMLILSTKIGSDSERNIEETRYFVLHLPGQETAEKVLHTAKPLPYGENELDDVGLDHEPYHVLESLKIPVVPAMPHMLCKVISWVPMARKVDHSLWLATVEDWRTPGRNGNLDVSDVLLHKGRNVFVQVGAQYEVEPY